MTYKGKMVPGIMGCDDVLTLVEAWTKNLLPRDSEASFAAALTCFLQNRRHNQPDDETGVYARLCALQKHIGDEEELGDQHDGAGANVGGGPLRPPDLLGVRRVAGPRVQDGAAVGGTAGADGGRLRGASTTTRWRTCATGRFERSGAVCPSWRACTCAKKVWKANYFFLFLMGKMELKRNILEYEEHGSKTFRVATTVQLGHP